MLFFQKDHMKLRTKCVALSGKLTEEIASPAVTLLLLFRFSWHSIARAPAKLEIFSFDCEASLKA
jgi:hypothetical protein